MSDLNLTETINTNDDINIQKDAKKRISYVSKDLKSMIEFVSKVYNQLGHTIHHSNKAIAAVVGLSPDSIKAYFSSAQQYKLFEIKYGVGYKVTEHFQKLHLPKDDNYKRAAIIESLKNPETYQQLFQDYEYHIVPQEGVRNHFIRNFGLNKDVAMKAAQVFMDNLKDFELLDKRGVLTSGLPSKAIIPEIKTDDEEKVIPANNGNPPDTGTTSGNMLPALTNTGAKVIFQTELDAAGKKTIPMYLIDNKQAMLVYPDDISEDDIELVRHQIDGILLRIKLEAKSRAQPAKESTQTKKGY